MFDGEAFGAEIVAHVRSHVANSIAPLLSEISLLKFNNEQLKGRIVELEARQPLRGEKGDKGDPGHDGKDADIAVIAKMVAEEVSKIPPAPAGKDGESIIGPPGPAGPQGPPGESIIGPPGESIRGEKGEPGERGERGPPGESIVGPPGRDGVGIASSFIDRDGNLVLTFTDGTVGSVGKVMGGQGPPGANGIDGKDGKDGRDGFGFDDIQVAMLDDGHTVEIKFVREGITKTFPVVFPNTKYCDIWQSEETYVRGDFVTWGGSGWIAKETSINERPGAGSKAWQLFTKKGRDGRDGKDGSSGPPGPAGPRGRDLTQMAFDGSKF